MRPIITLLTFLSFLISVPLTCPAEEGSHLAATCSNCHDPEPGVMMGFLDSIALKSKTLLMDFLDHKEVVSFTNDTKLVNVNSFQDIRSYRKKEFSVNYIEKNGQLIATEINRFQPMESIKRGDIKVDLISLEQFINLKKNKTVHIFDVRPYSIYQESHIPGAMPLPAPSFEQFKGNLPVDKSNPVILYGDGSCFAPITAIQAKGLGFQDVKIFAAGFRLWTHESYAITTNEWILSAIENKIPYVLIDTRNPEISQKGHIPGSISFPPDTLESRKGDFPYHENAPIVVYGADSEKAARLISSWDYTNVRILPTSFADWQKQKFPVNKGPLSSKISYEPKIKPGTISIPEFLKAVKSPNDVVMVDVRNPDEFDQGHISGSINIPVDSVKQRISEIAEGEELILYCPSGIRAEIAHNLYKSLGKKSRYLDAYVEIEKDGSFEVDEK